MSTEDVLKVLARERAENHVDQAELWRAYRAILPAAVALFARNTLEDVARGNALRDQCRALDAKIIVARTPGPEAEELRRQRENILTDPQTPEALAQGLQARCAELDAKIAALARPSLAAEELERQREKLYVAAQAVESRFPHDVMKREEAEVLAKGRQDGGAFKRLLSFLFGDAEATITAAALAELLERLKIPPARHRDHVRAWIAAGRAKVKMETRAGLAAEIARLEKERQAAHGRGQAAHLDAYNCGQGLNAVNRDWINAETAVAELATIEQDYPEIFRTEDAGSK